MREQSTYLPFTTESGVYNHLRVAVKNKLSYSNASKTRRLAKSESFKSTSSARLSARRRSRMLAEAVARRPSPDETRSP